MMFNAPPSWDTGILYHMYSYVLESGLVWMCHVLGWIAGTHKVTRDDSDDVLGFGD